MENGEGELKGPKCASMLTWQTSLIDESEFSNVSHTNTHIHTCGITFVVESLSHEQ